MLSSFAREKTPSNKGWILSMLAIIALAISPFLSITHVTTVHPRVVTMATADDVGKVMDDKPIEERKSFYKLVKGVSEYMKNATRLRDNVQLRDLIEEVIVIYDLQDKSYFQVYIDNAVEEAGIKKDADIASSKDKVIVVFDKLAASIKGSIERYKEVK